MEAGSVAGPVSGRTRVCPPRESVAVTAGEAGVAGSVTWTLIKASRFPTRPKYGSLGFQHMGLAEIDGIDRDGLRRSHQEEPGQARHHFRGNSAEDDNGVQMIHGVEGVTRRGRWSGTIAGKQQLIAERRVPHVLAVNVRGDRVRMGTTRSELDQDSAPIIPRPAPHKAFAFCHLARKRPS